MTRLKAIAIVGLLLGLVSPASAQSGCGGQFGALKFCGSTAGGLPGPILIPPGGTTTIGGGTVLGNPTAATALPIATVAPVLGIPGTSVGSFSFGNITSGTIKLQPTTGALGSSVLSLPAITDTLAGFALANGGTNNALTASNGGIVWSDASKLNILSGTATARQMLQSGSSATPAWSTTTWPATTTINRLLFSSSASVIGEISTANGGMLNASATGVPSMTVTPTLGVAGTVTGTLGFSGITSGTAVVTPQAAAGTPTLTLPNTSGTLADGATAPLALSSTTGNMSITGAAGQVLAGSSPAFTATPTLGVPTSSQGTLGFAGVTSGTATVTAQAVAGSPTITLPNSSGTLADGASSPLSLSSTTGNLTCSTCTTSAASLTANQLVIGSGSQGEQSLGSLGTTTTVLHGNAAGAPTFGSVAISTDISGLGTNVATALAGANYFFAVKIQTFSGSGTYTPSTGMQYVTLECWGSGGGGSGVINTAANQENSGGGGGAGSYARKTVTAATIGASKTVVIGGAGTAGLATTPWTGGNGADSCFTTSTCVSGQIVAGKLGAGAVTSGAGTGGLAGVGGAAGTGDITATGAPGGAGFSFTVTGLAMPNGYGASSSVGGGGASAPGNATGVGNSATGFASGGAGGVSFNAGGAAAGGAGAGGLCVATEYTNQ